MMVLSDEQLKEPWVQRAVLHLLDCFEKTQKFDLECGALYHAAHGLDLYRTRRFGPRNPIPSGGPLKPQPTVAASRRVCRRRKVATGPGDLLALFAGRLVSALSGASGSGVSGGVCGCGSSAGFFSDGRLRPTRLAGKFV